MCLRAAIRCFIWILRVIGLPVQRMAEGDTHRVCRSNECAGQMEYMLQLRLASARRMQGIL